VQGRRCLIVLDADIRGLLACAAAAREFGPGQPVWLAPGVDPSLEDARATAAQEQAATYEHSLLEHPSVAAGSDPGERQTRLMLEAGYLALRHGAEGVIWAGPLPETGAKDDLEALATDHSRALLIERLIALEQPSSAQPVSLRMPYSDFSDRQLADLALDMDLPVWTCWWWRLGRGPRAAPGFDLARVEYQRWESALKEAGWHEGVPGPATLEGTATGRTLAQ
jgi:hypothetical protein